MSTSAQLIEKLEQNHADRNLHKGKVKRSVHKTFDSATELIGWKFNEWDYGKPHKVALPTQARGLFTLKDTIAVRGYDKFFSIDEVQATKWESITSNTVGPYELSLKENGCIIFISGLATGELVVCSKHSTGYRDDVNRNHAEYGYSKLKHQLDQVGVAYTTLGKALYDMNVTAIAELCDDEFEEHVLKYTRDEAGLYLHGLNVNCPDFETFPMETVHEFADKYGFKKVDYFLEEDSGHLKQFLDECSKTGKFNGKEVEGFVIRCRLKDTGGSFFFKYKFEEPYLMYRQWREATKALIQGFSVSEINITSHKYQTLKYIEFILPILKQDEKLRDDYLAGHGIIHLRDLYLGFLGKSGHEIAAVQDDVNEFKREMQSLSLNSLSLSEKKLKYVIVTVATIGCGKTTVSLALNHLFPDWGHIQSDNIPSPLADKQVKGALDILEQAPCVIVDRNYHQYRERKEMFAQFEKLAPRYKFSANYRLKFICLNFVKDKHALKNILWNVTSNRVLTRGDNHQSIKASTDGAAKVEAIMRGFIGRFQNVMPEKEPDSRFNLVIDLDITQQDSSLKNLTTIVKVLNQEQPDLVPVPPNNDRISEAFAFALAFKPTITKMITDHSVKKQKKQSKPTYFALSFKDPSTLLEKVEDLLLVSSSERIKVIYQSLKQLNRLQIEYHVTLAHIAAAKQNRDVWNNFTKKYYAKELETWLGDSSGPAYVALPVQKASVKLQKICCTKDLLCLEVSIVDLQPPNHSDGDNICTNKYPHVTLGTIDESTKPQESNTVLESINDFNYSESQGHYFLPWDFDVIFDAEDLELRAFR